ncbi:MAG: DnaA ATPase domain-containing protein [Phycisphaerales bacterium]
MVHGNATLSVCPDPDTAALTAPGLLGSEDRIARRLRGTLGEDQFARYFAEGLVPAVGESEVRIPVASAFIAGLLERRFHEQLRRVVAEETGRGDVSIRFVVAPVATPPTAVTPAAPRAPLPQQAPRGPVAARLRHEPRPRRVGGDGFDGLVIAPANTLAVDSARRQIADPSGAPRLLVVFGACGVGKTHLLESLAAEYAEAFAGRHVRCLSGEAFLNAFIGACVHKRFERFRAGFRTTDLLVIDDLQTLAHKPGTQAELVNTLDALSARGGRVVMSMCCEPRRLDGFSPALVSRLCAGLVVGMAAPERAYRARLIAALAGRRGLVLEEPALNALVAACGDCVNVRDVEGVIMRVDAVHRLLLGGGGGLAEAPAWRGTAAERSGITVGIRAVDHALGRRAERSGAMDAVNVRSSSAPRPLRPEAILACACRLLGVSVDEVLGRSRGAPVVLARALAGYLARELTAMSYPEIARALGRPNHSSVITAFRRFQRQVAACAVLSLGHGRTGVDPRDLVARARDELAVGPVWARAAA